MRSIRRAPVLRDPDASLSETLSLLETRRRAARRRFLGALAATGALPAMQAAAALSCSVIPSETEGPYPADGTNGPNVLAQSGIVRADIRPSFGSAGTAVAGGTRLTVTLQLVNTDNGCAPLAGYAVYLWHCDAQGRYSLYSPGATTQNYLRGVQVTDASGQVTFTTIFPGCYAGRWPHIHFEIYSSLAQASSGRSAIKTSQLALPESACRTVYAQTALYPSSAGNLNQVSLLTDGIFADDGAALQLASTSGDNTSGYASGLQVGLAAGAGVGASQTQDVIEYYNAELDHYFVTWVPSEIALLDAGRTLKGWTRTGYTFKTFASAQVGTSAVCRYYIPPASGDSHFFGRDSLECTDTGTKFASFVLEESRFMHMYLPSEGVCAANTTPVYRLFNNRADANHRYTTVTAVRDAMIAKGWTAEGDGPDRVVMCAPK